VGVTLAWTLAREGKRVAAVERKYIGGSCPNIAGLPSKNVIHSAKVASYSRRAEELGLPGQGATVDMAVVRSVVQVDPAPARPLGAPVRRRESRAGRVVTAAGVPPAPLTALR
jgi:hypothetical protein